MFCLCSMASCTAAKLGGRVAEAASACCGSLLRVESLIQLGLVPKPRSNMVRVPHMRQAHNWCGLDLTRPAQEQCLCFVTPALSTPQRTGNRATGTWRRQ